MKEGEATDYRLAIRGMVDSYCEKAGRYDLHWLLVELQNQSMMVGDLLRPLIEK